MLTKDDFDTRLTGLKAGRQGIRNQISKLTADLHATDGAIEECEHWMAALEAREEDGKHS